MPTTLLEMPFKTLIVAAAVLSLGVAGAAGAKVVTVTVTKNGYVPKDLSIAVGDSVQFTNGDSIAHQVSFRTTTGLSCSPNPLVLQPSQSGTCTFSAPGSYTYSDPNQRGNTFRGTVTVTGAAIPERLTLTAQARRVVYGAKLTLTGTLSTQKVGESVDVSVTPCGQTAASRAATVQTTTGGAYTAVVTPLKNTSYTARLRNMASAPATVTVAPSLRLGKVAPRRYSLRVAAAQTFAGKYATFQRYNGTLRRWVNIKRVLLRANTTGTAPTVLTTARFGATVRARSRVRAILPQLQVGSCYAPGQSNVILG
jgi:plastocyanin